MMKAKKSLGQNFLVDNNIINKIIDEVDAKEEDLILEIGPGRGALTKRLVKKNCNLIAYELDTDMKFFLEKLENEKVRIIYGDFLKSDFKRDIENINYNDIFIVGNLPYYITTPIIEHVIREKIKFSKFTIMVQKEVADRFMAKPKSKDYGYITLVLKYYFDINRVCDVSNFAFNPVPKVESTVLSLNPRKEKILLNEDEYFKFLKDAFKQKRKTLKNNLSNYDWRKVSDILKKHGYGENVRAEELEEYVMIDIFNNI